MNQFWLLYRTVVVDPRAQEFLDTHSLPSSRFSEHWEGIEWLLSRTPGIGLPKSKASPGKHVLWVSGGNELAGTRDVWVLYSYDEETVTIHGIRFGPEVL